MKIGILTYHFSHNFGAVLQCFALQTALKEEGYDAVVINYVSDEQEDNVSTYRKIKGIRMFVKNAALLPFHFRRERKREAFEGFQKEYLDLTNRVRSQAELNRLIRFEEITHIVVGSDQVWSPRIKEFDKVFFLTDVNGVKKTGYSVSLGDAVYEELLPFEDNIKKFDEIAVREKRAYEIVSKIVNKDVLITPDPTFLLTRDFWKKFSCYKAFHRKKYLLCYFLNKEKYKSNMDFSRKIAAEKRLELVLVDPRVSLLSIMNHGIIEAGPKEFLHLVFNSELVITDSFHGTVFSILLNKQFISINNNIGNTDTRRSDLLKKYNLLDRYMIISKTRAKELDNFQCNFTKANQVIDDEVSRHRENLLRLIL